MSIGQNTQALNLDGSGLTLILGENLDLGSDGNRNGSGKTSILNALSFALYGYPLGNIKKDNLVNKINSHNMVVSLDFESNGKKYKIERGRKPNFLHYFVNDGLINSPDTNESQGESKWTQGEIEKAIGLSHLMFRHMVTLTTDTEAFLKMKASDQRVIIEELLGITLLSQKSEALKELIKNTKERSKEEEVRIKLVNDTNIRIQRSVDELLIKIHLWDKQHDEKINELTLDKKSLEGVDFNFEIKQFDLIDVWEKNYLNLKQELSTLEKDKKLLESQISTLIKDAKYFRSLVENNSLAQKNRLSSEITRKRREIENIQNEKKSIDEKYQNVEKKLSNPDSFLCQTCNQPLKDDKHKEIVISNLNKEKNELSNRKKNLDSNLLQLEKQIKETEKEILDLEESTEKSKKEHILNAEKKEKEAELFSEKLIKSKENILTKTNELNGIGDRPQSVFPDRNKAYQAKSLYEQVCINLENEITKINPHIEHLDSLKKNIQTIDYSVSNELNKLKDHQDVLLKLLTSKDSFIRKKIIDQNLAFLNHRLKYYLEKLNLPHEVKFINDLSVEIQKLGQDFDFDNLSNGEQLRVIVALSFGFRDIWESMNSNINLLFIDEVIDAGLDPAGVESILEILKKSARERGKNIFLISHREEMISRVSNVLVIQKENGFSTINTDFESHSTRI